MTETWAKRTLVGTCAVVSVLSLLLILTFDYGRDQGIYAVVARSVLGGGMPYRDAWDFKPPGIFVIYAIARALFGSHQFGIRILEVCGLIAMSAGLVGLARRLWGEPMIGVIAATLAILVHTQLDFWHTAQPESFGGMLTIAGLCCALAIRRRWLAWCGAGALFGFAGLLKPPLVAGAGVIALMLVSRLWHETRERGRRARVLAALAPIVIVGTGVIASLLACLAWFAARGAVGDMYQVLFVFTPNYTKLGWNQPVAWLLMHAIQDWLFVYSSLLTAGILVLTVARPTLGERFGVRLLLAVIAFHIIGVAMQGKFFPYHWGATIPLSALLAALGVWKVWQRAVTQGSLALAGFVVGVIALASMGGASEDFLNRSITRFRLLFDGDQSGWDRLSTVADVNAGANRAVAAWLREHVPHDEPIYIWGFEPVIYDLADRPAATRFIYNVPQRVRWATADARRELMRELNMWPPAAIVVEHRDVFPFVTGNRSDSAAALEKFPELALMLASYTRVVRIEDLDIYLRR